MSSTFDIHRLSLLPPPWLLGLKINDVRAFDESPATDFQNADSLGMHEFCDGLPRNPPNPGRLGWGNPIFRPNSRIYFS